MSTDDELSALTRATPTTTREAIEGFARRATDVLNMFNVAHAATEAIARGHFDQVGGPVMEPRIRAFALGQMEQGYPLVVQQALVTLWGTVESTMKYVCLALVNHDPNVLLGRAFSKLKVRVAEFLGLEDQERVVMVLKELDRSLVESAPAGIERFEAMLAALGLAGEADPEVKKTLLELYEVRNLYVHRAGVADRHFKRACPWRKEAVGDPVCISTGQVGEYVLAVARYVREVASRLARTTVKAPAHLLYPGATPQWQEARTPHSGFGSATAYAFTSTDRPSTIGEYYRSTLSQWRVAESEQTSERMTLILIAPDDNETLGITAETKQSGTTVLSLLHCTKDRPSA
jgi:hypothetical protein